MRQKLITLCPISFEYAKNKQNFSKWVRMTLLKEPEILQEVQEMEEEIAFLKEACFNWSQRYYKAIELEDEVTTISST